MLTRPEVTGKSIAGQLADALADGGWRSRARPLQLPPSWDWLGWLILSGRGWGKSWCGSSWINEVAMTSVCRTVLIGATASDVRDIMIEGDSGVLRTAPDHFRPIFEPSKRRIEWPNGSVAHCFSAEEADRLRGPQFHYGWLDELAAFVTGSRFQDVFTVSGNGSSEPRFVSCWPTDETSSRNRERPMIGHQLAGSRWRASWSHPEAISDAR
jgi:phage terminase large subunit-like protein